MKQITNIIMLTLVLTIPFALSQTRKAIPAGRYEALSGVKISHSLKGTDSTFKDTLGLFWSEVTKHIQGRSDNFFYASGKIDKNLKAFLSSKGVIESKDFDDKVNILLSDNFSRDINSFKKLSIKGSLVILIDKHKLKEVIANLTQFELLSYQAGPDINYFLLKAQ